MYTAHKLDNSGLQRAFILLCRPFDFLFLAAYLSVGGELVAIAVTIGDKSTRQKLQCKMMTRVSR